MCPRHRNGEDHCYLIPTSCWRGGLLPPPLAAPPGPPTRRTTRRPTSAVTANAPPQVQCVGDLLLEAPVAVAAHGAVLQDAVEEPVHEAQEHVDHANTAPGHVLHASQLGMVTGGQGQAEARRRKRRWMMLVVRRLFVLAVVVAAPIHPPFLVCRWTRGILCP
jgi:hypothetical protein